jgi:lipopolysaccharide transport system ATP-binding protein
MGDLAIRVEGLGKRYRIGVRRQRQDTVRDALADGLRAPLGWLRGNGRGNHSRDDTIWALRDVSFEVKRGQAVGVIGRNGAGKSTLLKILSRITRPTKGYAEIHGRVGSLLEVGTGFHPELTGRENVYLNGAVLGMRKTEIDRRFDEIVAFAEIERFLDTPVKRYSSGMYVRLAFAVAAHLEPEILLVDEVLAVGDAAFQKKCLGKMGDVTTEGRTVLFVSHNMGAIQRLCGRALLIGSGQLQEQGDPGIIVGNYLSDATVSDSGDFDTSNHPARAARYHPVIRRVILSSSDGSPRSQFYPDESLQVDLFLEPSSPIKGPRVAATIEDSFGRRIMTMASYFENAELPAEISRPCRLRCILSPLNLGSGRYLIGASIGTRYGGLLDSIDGVASLDVGWRDNYHNGEPYLSVYGPVLTRSTWVEVK